MRLFHDPKCLNLVENHIINFGENSTSKGTTGRNCTSLLRTLSLSWWARCRAVVKDTRAGVSQGTDASAWTRSNFMLPPVLDRWYTDSTSLCACRREVGAQGSMLCRTTHSRSNIGLDKKTLWLTCKTDCYLKLYVASLFYFNFALSSVSERKPYDIQSFIQYKLI